MFVNSVTFSCLCHHVEFVTRDVSVILNSFPIALSHWCIFHRGKAELVVATWDKQFHNSEMVQKVPLLYLANDILQNSKRKGNEFVTEFWKVLPSALKDVLENGDSHGKNVISRLVSLSYLLFLFSDEWSNSLARFKIFQLNVLVNTDKN